MHVPGYAATARAQDRVAHKSLLREPAGDRRFRFLGQQAVQ